MGKETALPKNIRQIGEIQGEERVCLEDYVMTYIRKKEDQEKEGYLGLFLGETSRAEDGLYVFIRGILEVPAQEEGEELQENLRKQYQKYFPDWEIQGCCVIGQYQTDRMNALSELIPEAGRLIYHLQEQEENLYWTEGGRYKKMKGYFIFYEQNRRMQEYLADVFRENSVEKESLPDRAIKSFREKVKEKSEGKSRSSMLKMASSFFVVTVLVIGAIMVNRMDTIRTIQGLRGTSEQTGENEALGQITMSGSSPVSGNSTDGTSYGTNSGTGQQSAASGDGSVAASSAVTKSDTVDLTSSILGNGAVPAAADAENSAAASGSDVANSGDAGADEGAIQTSAPSSDGLQPSDPAATADGEIQPSDPAATTDGVIQSSNSAAAPDEGSQPADSAAVSNGEGQPTDSAAVSNGESQSSDSAEVTAGPQSGDPSAEPASAPVRQTRASYTIRVGDTLADICNKYYGSLDKLTEICQANDITDANMIMPGQKIVLP